MPRAVIATLPEPVQIAEILGLPRPGSFDDIKLVDCDSAHTDNFLSCWHRPVIAGSAHDRRRTLS